jgi:protein-S-isoprenylcysteine O-methyltransferase Ste14
MSDQLLSEHVSADRPNTTPWPPILYVAAFVGAYLLEQIVPFWPYGEWVRPWAGILAAIGFLIAASGLNYFQAIDTPVNPTGQAKQLATEGIYRFTRNPMYLGAVIMLVGLSGAFRSGWLLIAAAAVAYGLQRLAIEPEEAYLSRRFGNAYRDYCANVRRWS